MGRKIVADYLSVHGPRLLASVDLGGHCWSQRKAVDTAIPYLYHSLNINMSYCPYLEFGNFSLPFLFLYLVPFLDHWLPNTSGQTAPRWFWKASPSYLTVGGWREYTPQFSATLEEKFIEFQSRDAASKDPDHWVMSYYRVDAAYSVDIRKMKMLRFEGSACQQTFPIKRELVCLFPFLFFLLSLSLALSLSLSLSFSLSYSCCLALLPSFSYSRFLSLSLSLSVFLSLSLSLSFSLSTTLTITYSPASTTDASYASQEIGLVALYYVLFNDCYYRGRLAKLHSTGRVKTPQLRRTDSIGISCIIFS
mgnify:CR=1 FL=1